MSINLLDIKKIRKYTLYILGIIMLIFFLVWLFLQTSYGQNKVFPIALRYLSKTLNTEIKASRIDLSFFDEIHLDDVLAFDQQGDTLAFIQRLDADIGLFSLFGKELSIDDLKLKGTSIHLKETSKDQFNYSHIIAHLESGESEQKKPNDAPWNINLNNIKLNDTKFQMTNIGSSLYTYIESLNGDLKSFSLPESFFHFERLDVEGLKVDYLQTDNENADNPPTGFPSLPFGLLMDQLSIQGDQVGYNGNTKKSTTTDFDPNHISLNQLNLEGENLFWRDSISFEMTKLNVKMRDEFELIDLSSGISFSNQNLQLDNTNIQTPTSEIQFDFKASYKNFAELIDDIQNTNTEINIKKSIISKKDINYFIDNKDLSDINLSVLEDINIVGKVSLTKKRLNAKGIKLYIGKKLSIAGSLSSNNIQKLDDSFLSFNINKFATSQSYIESLLPTLVVPKEMNDLGHLNGKVIGILGPNELILESLVLNTSEGTSIDGIGKIYEFQNTQEPKFDFSFNHLRTNVNKIVSDRSILPEEIQKLEDIQYIGQIQGSFKNIISKGKFNTSLGNLDLDANIQFNDDYTDGKYNGFFNLENFDLGYMLNDSILGNANFEGNIDGSGFSIENLDTKLDGKIKSFCYEGYVYEDIEINGSYSDSIFVGKLKSNDVNLNLDIEGKMDFRGSSSSLDITMDMNSLNLNELGFSKNTMNIGGIFKGKVKGNSVDDFLGNGTISEFRIETDKGYYSTDSIVTIEVAEINQNAKVFSIDAPFIEGDMKGKVTPSTLIRFVKNYIKAYIPLEIGYDENIEDNLDKYFEENEDQNFIFSAKTKDIDPFLIPFFGDDLSVVNASLGANFSSQEARLNIKGIIDSVMYKDILLQRGSFFFDGRKSFINGNVYLEDISMDNEILIPLTTINTVLNNKVANLNIAISNEDDIERLNLGGDLTRTDEYILTFEDSIYLNGFNWQFSPYNQIIFGDYGLYMQDVKLSKGNQAITIYTDENKNGEAIEVLFDNFTLAELTAIINKENEFFEGEIDGYFTINSLYLKPFITANLDLNNITVDGEKAGNLYIQAEQDVASNTVTSNIRLSGLQNEASLILDYGIQNQSTIGALDITRLEMSIIDPYLTEIFVDSEGFVEGNVKINGDLNNLDLQGDLKTHNVKTTPVFTNSRYEVLDTKVTFTDTEIDFGTVELVDRNKNSAFVTGKIFHTNLRNSVVDLNVNTENFEFLNTTSDENELFYGNVFVSGYASIFGSIDDIVIDGTISAVNNSKLNVSPLSIESELLGDDFIIYSGDPRGVHIDSLQLEVKKPKIALPFDVELKVNVDKDSEFSMILNPITGDKLTSNGTSDLELKLNKSGEMQMYGTYTVTQGFYTFSYGLISKDFNIRDGSTVTFNGDPLEGILNVDAVYVANTSVYDLIQLETELKENEKYDAQRKRNMNVILSLTKSIMKPEINLDIRVDEDELKSSISDILDRKLNQLREEENEMNNQVFGLLLFNNFILAKSTDTDLAKTGTNIAISSISGLISSQLNKLTDGIIKGFEVNFDLDSYSSDFLAQGQEGQVTELGLEVEQTLFDNKLTISAGTNINLETTSQQSDLNAIAGDFILDYKLNKDGSYRLKVFRKNSLERLADENTSKNGASFFYRKEFGEIEKKKE